MGCSGTPFLLVDLLDVWPRYLARASRLPPQDVIEALMDGARGKALTFEGPDGLIIAALTPREDALELHVLLAVSTGAPGAFERQEAAVCAIARDLGASAVSFTPARRGWAKLLGPEWITRGTSFVRRLHGRQKRRGQGDPTTSGDGPAGHGRDGRLQGTLAPLAAADGAAGAGPRG